MKKNLLEKIICIKRPYGFSYLFKLSLLEILNAQRTFNEIQSTYYEALFNRAAALVNLEKSAGIWDINF
jgi:hypothetical protein